MSDDALIAAADLETARQLRGALDVAMAENAGHIAELQQAGRRIEGLSHQIGELNTTVGYQDAMLAQLRTALNEALRLALVPEQNQDEAWYAAFDRIAAVLDAKARTE